MNSLILCHQVEIARVTCEKERRHREKEVSEDTSWEHGGEIKESNISGEDGKSAADGGEAEQGGAGQSPGSPAQTWGQEASVQVKTSQEEKSTSDGMKVLIKEWNI